MIKLELLPETTLQLQVAEKVIKTAPPVIAPKRITENGTYAAKEEGVYGFDPVTVEVDMTIAREEGRQAEYDRFWNGIQNSGNRSDYSYAFTNWQLEQILPKYPLRSVNLYYTFANCFQVKQITKDILPVGDAFDMSYGAFHQCYALEEIGFDLPIRTTNVNGMNVMFNECHNLKTIGKITLDDTAYAFSNTFTRCYALENVTFGGTIAGSLSFVHSGKLSPDSVASILAALQNRAGLTSLTLTLHKDVGEKLTNEQKAAITAKNWILVY